MLTSVSRETKASMAEPLTAAGKGSAGECRREEVSGMADKIMTLQQAADFLQMDADTLRVLARKGRVPGAKVGRQWRFDQGLLREWLRERSLRNHREDDANS